MSKNSVPKRFGFGELMIGLLLTIMVLMVVVIVLFWLKKTLFIFGFFFKIFTLLMFAAIAISIITGYYIIKDATDFRDNFQNSTSMIVVEDTLNNTGLVAGITFNPKEQRFDPMNKERLEYVDNSFKDDDFRSINDEYYKIFVIDVQSFETINLRPVYERNVNITGAEMQRIMLSDNARLELAKIIASKDGEDVDDILDSLTMSSEEVKSHLLTYYLSTVFDPTNVGGLLGELRSSHIQVYENTALFRAIRLIPSGIVSMMIKF